MVIDSSVLVAILLNEPDKLDFIKAIDTTNSRNISAASFVETSLVIASRYGAKGTTELDTFIARAKIHIRTVDKSQALIARQAHQEFGKGNHPARLNFGDCFSYALAKYLGQPLLFKGKDFLQTDINPFQIS